MPGALPPRSHKARNSLVFLIIVAAAVIGAVPSLRADVARGYHHVRYDIAPSYPKVPVESVLATGEGACGPAQLSGNDTVYWYTRASTVAPQVLSVTLAPGFTGKVAKVAFTPLVASTSAPPSGQASPGPETLSVTWAGGSTTVALANPPKFQQVDLNLPATRHLHLRAVATDPGAGPTTCAETALVFYQRTG